MSTLRQELFLLLVNLILSGYNLIYFSSLEPISIGLLIIDNIGANNEGRTVLKEKYFYGKRCIKKFFKYLIDKEEWLMSIQNPEHPIEAFRYL